MQTFHEFMPGYRLNEYLLVISPNEDLRNRIAYIKKDFQEKYKSPLASAKPHITLAKFVTWNMMEEKLINRLQHISMGVCPFKIELKNFGSYPSHTIYINVATKIPVQNLVKEIRSTQRMMKAHPDYDPHFISDPHLTIARKLKPWQYEKGWLEYSHLHFSARVVADSMLLLRRPLGDRAYQVVRSFDFLNMPVAITQGDLFV
jgi:2'-5' RNA ligase